MLWMELILLIILQVTLSLFFLFSFNFLSPDATDQSNQPIPVSSWSDGRDFPSSSVAGGYEDEIVLTVNDNYNFPLDDDLEWLLSAKATAGGYANESRDIFLNQVNDSITAAIPATSSAPPSRGAPRVSPDFMPVETNELRKELGNHQAFTWVINYD
jgi:hypothetical protein